MPSPQVAEDPARLEIAQARRAARRVWWVAMVSIWAGIVIVVVAAIRFFVGDLEFDAAVNVASVVGIAGIASGAAFYASSWNMRISATRLEQQLKR